MNLTEVVLLGKLYIPGLTFHHFIPVSNNTILVSIDSLNFEVFTTKDSINFLNDIRIEEDGTSKLVDVSVEQLFARFKLSVADENFSLLEEKKEPQCEITSAYREALSKLRRKIWEFARYELGQNLEKLSYNTTPEITLFRQSPEGRIVLLQPKEGRMTTLKGRMSDEAKLFGISDQEAFKEYISGGKTTDICWLFLMNAYDHIDDKNYRMAVIEACISIERVMKIKLANRLKQEDIYGIEELFQAAGITKVIKYVLPLIVEDKHEINDELQKELVALFALRNSIMHSSRLNVGEDVARKVINTASATLDIIIPRYLTVKRKECIEKDL